MGPDVRAVGLHQNRSLRPIPERSTQGDAVFLPGRVADVGGWALRAARDGQKAAFLDALEFPWRLSLSYLAHLLYRTAHTAPNTQATTTRRVPRDEPIPGCGEDREATFAPKN